MPTIASPTRISIDNILLTTDFSEASRAAVPYASALARLYGAKVFLAHVVSPDPHLSVPLDRLPHEADPVWQEAWRNTADFLQHTPLEKVTHEEILERGELWDVISSIIADHEIDLLVLGTRGRQGLRKLVLGSEAEKIYRQAPCPVLTVGPNAGISGRPHKPRQILFPTDISESSLRALPYALSLAEENEATLTLLHFVPLVPWQEQGPVAESAQRRLEALVPEEAKLWCEPKYVARFEFPVEGVLRVAEEEDADLIVMGVRQTVGTTLTSHLPWTIASEIVSEAPCPVLTVRG
jgi:nucleotide-binding universal stress UspA family protein